MHRQAGQPLKNIMESTTISSSHSELILLGPEALNGKRRRKIKQKKDVVMVHIPFFGKKNHFSFRPNPDN